MTAIDRATGSEIVRKNLRPAETVAPCGRVAVHLWPGADGPITVDLGLRRPDWSRSGFVVVAQHRARSADLGERHRVELAVDSERVGFAVEVASPEGGTDAGVRDDAGDAGESRGGGGSLDESIAVPGGELGERLRVRFAAGAANDGSANGEELPVAGELGPATGGEVRGDEVGDIDVGSSGEQVAELDHVEIIGPGVVGDAERARRVSEMTDVAADIADDRDPPRALTHRRLRSPRTAPTRSGR